MGQFSVTEVKSGNNTIRYTYDNKRRVKAVSLNGVDDYVTYSYNDANKNAEAVTATMADGTIATSVKNAHGNVTKSSVGNENVEYQYNNKQLPEIITEKINETTLKTTEISYTDEGNIESVKLNGNEIEHYTYTDKKLLTEKKITLDALEQTYEYAYKSTADRALESIVIAGNTVRPQIDALGRSAGKTIEIGENKIAEEKISYLKFGDHATSLPSTMRFGNRRNGSFVLMDSLKYKYDSMGNIVEVFENGRSTCRYEYDALGRLTREDNVAFAKTTTWAYDNNGNILAKYEYALTAKPTSELHLLDCTCFSYAYDDNSDQLMSYNGELFVYDTIGNPTTYRGKTATWAYGRRLTSFDGATFTYDARGRRTGKNDITFTYDNNGNLIGQSNGLEFLYDHTGVFAFKYNGSTYFYRKNAQQDVIAILDSNGSVVVEYRYDAWGKCQTTVVDSTAAEIATLNPFRYRSYYLDTETDLYFLKTRYYDPEIGRFITIDDISYLDPESINGLNLYAYCGNNPVMMTDENGCAPALWQWIFAGIAIAGAITISVLTMGTATPVLAGMLIGGAISAAFEIGSQIVFDGGIHDIGAILSATLGGLVAGAISGIPVFSGFTLGNYIGTAILGGVASVVGGIISGGVHDINSFLIAFSLGSLGNVAAKAVNQLVVNRIAGKIMNSSSAKGKSLAINNYMIKYNVKPMGFGHSTFGGWSRNLFKDMSKAFFKTVVADTTSRSAIVYSALISSSISGWY